MIALAARPAALVALVALAVSLSAVAAPASAAPAEWTPPVTISTVGDYAFSSQVTASPNGTLTAIWVSQLGEVEVVQVSTSIDGGLVWSTPLELSATDGYVHDPQVTASPNGTLTAIWSRSVGAADLVIESSASTDGGATWTAPALLSDAGERAFYPQVTASPDSTLTAVWSGIVAGILVIQTSTSTDDGTSWSVPLNLSAVGNDAHDPQVTAAPNGNLTAIWFRQVGLTRLIETSTSNDGGATWTAPVTLSDVDGDSWAPQVTASPDGRLTAVWGRSVVASTLVQASTSNDGGATWSTPIDLSTAGDYESRPQVTVSPDGTLTAIWSQDHLGDYVIKASTSTDGGASWSTAADLSATSDNANYAQLVAAPDGTLTAVWSFDTGNGVVIQSSTSTNRGVTWSTPVALSAEGEYGYGAHLAVLAGGTVVAVWERDVPESIAQIQAATLSAVTPAGTGAQLATTGVDTAPIGIAAALALLIGATLVFRRCGHALGNKA